MTLTLLDKAAEITPTRNFNLTYIILDLMFLCVLLGLLIYKKKYVTVAWSIFGGLLYFAVDFGLFYLVHGSRQVFVNGNEQDITGVMWVLLWMSISYGITNFAFIWLCLDKDKDLKEWLILIIGWWLVAPSLQHIYLSSTTVTTLRTTNEYHFIMALMLVVGYMFLIIRNLATKKEKINLLRLNIIGISVQFCWEFALLINGIRPMDNASIMTLLVNSVIETNLGMPYIYYIYKFISKRYNEDFSLKEVPSKEINQEALESV